MTTETIDWRKKLAAAGVTLSLVWVTWVSASVSSVQNVQAASEVSIATNSRAAIQVSLLTTDVALLDLKLNLLLRAEGIPVPSKPKETH